MNKLTEDSIRRIVRNVLSEMAGDDEFTSWSNEMAAAYGPDMGHGVWSHQLADWYGHDYLNQSSDFLAKYPGHAGWSHEMAKAYGPDYLNWSSDLSNWYDINPSAYPLKF